MRRIASRADKPEVEQDSLEAVNKHRFCHRRRRDWRQKQMTLPTVAIAGAIPTDSTPTVEGAIRIP